MKSIKELEENIDWQLYDAQEGTTVYTDLIQDGDGFLASTNFKDIEKQKKQNPQIIKNDN